jgi:heterodisulfide reductase subunit C
VSGAEMETLLEGCTRCGLCREVCIVERLGAHSITSFLCGEEEYSSWLCSSCWRCQEVCPQGVDIHSIIMEKRRQEEPPAGHESNLVNVQTFGYALRVDDSVNELRRFHGLDEVQLIPGEWVKILLSGREEGSTGG